MSLHLSKIERETIILFNEEEKTATVDTCNAALIRRMDQYSAEDTQCSLVRKDEYGAKYVCPKSWVKVRRPKQYTEEQRQKMAESARQRFGRAKQTEEA